MGSMARWLCVCGMIACTGEDTKTGDTDTAGPIDTVVDTEGSRSDSDPPPAQVDSDPPDTADSAAAPPPEDTGPPLVTYVVSGLTLCVDGLDDLGNVIHGDPAVPREVRVLTDRGMDCLPLLGSSCTYSSAYYAPLATVSTDAQGAFSLTFDAVSLDGLWLFSDTTLALGNCGNGLQFTERPLDEIQMENGGSLTDLTVDVYSVFF